MINTALQYHRDTSYERGKISGHYLDWSNQPDVFKEYKGIETVLLPEGITGQKENLLSILKLPESDTASRTIEIDDLARILRLTYSFTAKTRHGQGEFYYRSAASAGALYPTEIYVAASGIKGLDDGLYHFEIHRHGLSPLRKGSLADHISTLIFPAAEKLPALTFVFSAIRFRSSWKYRDRAYRYNLLDTGHALENLVIAMKALRLPLDVSYDFNDAGINKLIGVDEKKEAALAVAAVPGSPSASDPGGLEVDRLPKDILDMSVVSGKEIDYSAIEEIHKAGDMGGPGEAAPHELPESPALLPGTWDDLPDTSRYAGFVDYPDCLFMRRSSRNFVNASMDKDRFFSILDSLCSNDAATMENGSAHSSLLTVGFIAENIEGTPSGLYVLDRFKRRYGMVTSGSFTGRMSQVCLDQEWLKNAGLHFLFIISMDLLEKTWGPRGYRYALMNAGRMGQRLYVAATSLGLGCCGIGALYDSEAADLIGLSGESKLLYLVAVGKVKRL